MEDYFAESYDKVFHHEGGFVDDPDDRGGMTFMLLTTIQGQGNQSSLFGCF